MPNYGKWPNLPSKKYINLTVIEKAQKATLDNSSALVYGNIQAVRRKRNISFQDVAKHDENGILPRFVLVEGAPGVGKSTFAWEACRKWAEGEILEDFELVILIKLRDDSIRKATCLGDLIQYPRDSAIRQAVIDEITKSGGKGVLLLLEGYDELPASLQDEGSLFREVISGKQFDAGTVLVTSRHWASQSLLLPNKTNRPVSQHIEILGFTRENIKDYVSSMLEKEPSLLKDLQQYLEIYPYVRSMMYIPLNCAIVVDVYRHSKKENMMIPKTMTELYHSLTQSLLLRHTYPECKNLTLGNLPLSIRSHFYNLTELAYKSICVKQNTQIIFAEEELPSGLDTLGLMQSSMELYVDEGAKTSFNFLHLTIQEFLAAYHIYSYHSSDSQVRVFYRAGMVATFLAGLSPSALQEFLTKINFGGTQSFEDEQIHMLFEAKVAILPYKVCKGHATSPFYSYMLGHLIANSSFPWQVWIEGTAETIDLFVGGLSNRQCRADLLYISAVSEIAELSNAKLALEKLELQRTSSYAKHDFFERAQNHVDICLFFDNLSNGCLLSFKHLTLSWFCFNNEEAKKIESYLSTCSVIKSLELICCKFESTAAAILMDGVKACSSLEKLVFTNDSDNMCDAACEMVMCNKSLKELQAFSCNLLNFCALAKALHANQTIEVLTITGDVMPWALKKVALVGNNEDKDTKYKQYFQEARICTSSELAKMLIQNKSLIELNVCNFDLDLRDICTVLCDNCTLRKLSLSVERGPELETISELLKRSKTLEVLQLLLNVEGASTIAMVMCKNNTLKELHLLGEVDGTDAFVSLLKRNTSLRKLSMEWNKKEHCDKTWLEQFATLCIAMSQNKSLLHLEVFAPSQYYSAAFETCKEYTRISVYMRCHEDMPFLDYR